MLEKLDGWKTYITVAVIAIGTGLVQTEVISQDLYTQAFNILVMLGLVFARKGKITAADLKEIRRE